jgi:hypothetical protein
MKLTRLAVIAALATGLCAGTLVRAEASPKGLVEFPHLTPSASGDIVEVNLQSGLLSMASRVVADKDPEAAQLIKGIKQVRVNVVKIDDTNRAATAEQLDSVRKALSAQGWEDIVIVRGKDEGDVRVQVRTRGEEAIEGLVVTVLNQKDGAVMVNIVGEIRPEQLAKLSKNLNIPGLDKLCVEKKQG